MDKTKIAIAVFDDRANEYQEKFMAQDLYHASFDRFCDAVTPQQAHVLELACGPGNITRYLLEKRPDFRILATDLSPNMLDLARKNNPGASFQLLDCRAVGQLDRSFDAVMFGFGLPYLSKRAALKLIRDVSGLLRPGGMFYLSTMEDDYRQSDWKLPSSGVGPKVFIHYHQADYLVEALQRNGFDLIDASRVDFPGATTQDLLLLARKRVSSPGRGRVRRPEHASGKN